MKICIVGCGYVGKAAAIKWRGDRHEITVTTRSLERAYTLRPFADLVYILDEDWRELVEKQDVVLISVAPDAQSDYMETYLRTAEKLVKAVKGSQVSQIIYTGSTSVYGEHQGQWVDENTLPRPLNCHAQILLATEQRLLQADNDQRKVCIFRLGEICGPDRSLEDRVKKLQGSVCSGSGESMTNLIHLDDIISALDTAMKQKLSGLYNLCNDVHIPRKDLYKNICETYGWPMVQWNASMTNSHSGNKIVSNAKLKSTGWFPKH